jgi:hypothetical protein
LVNVSNIGGNKLAIAPETIPDLFLLKQHQLSSCIEKTVINDTFVMIAIRELYLA